MRRRMENRSWIEFKKLYRSMFHANDRVVDLIAVYEILLFSVSGRSNLSISRYLDMDIDYVSDVLQEFLKFQGFEYDLDINPSCVFDRVTNFDEFVEDIKLISPLSFDKEMILWYSVCNKFDSIRKEIDNFYEQSDRPS